MKIVLDTNILLSVFLTRGGVAEQLFAKVVAAHATLTSEYVLQEAARKLSKKLGVPDREVAAFIGYARSRMTVIDLSGKKSTIDFEDPKDIPILFLLEVAGAHYFVTGDKALLELKKHKKTLILSLREALELL
ncbi:MAG: putative toxin-antitoxin system toxin component, PIN family [Candidatus Omnitrophica bacterium]|nr:putative toxin-antitoxin system toxin component, PIN family [Candidatus Omnitrophota bacterium]